MDVHGIRFISFLVIPKPSHRRLKLLQVTVLCSFCAVISFVSTMHCAVTSFVIVDSVTYLL